MRPGSAGLLALLWSFSSNIATASPLADDARPMPGLRPRQGSATGSTPTTTTPLATTLTTNAPGEATTTITETVTQGGGAGGTVTVTSNVLRTVITTIVVTTTTFETTTVTSNDVATATMTLYVTSTVLAKRWLNFLPAETAPVDALAPVITPTAAADLRKHAVIEKRAIVTVTVTFPGSAGADVTVTNLRTSTVVRTTTSILVHTSTIVSTVFNNAQTTVTVTSTLIVTSTSIDTSSPTTVEIGPSGSNIATVTDGGTSSTDGASTSGELSTGAKAGIGAGVGVVGLALLTGIGWWLYKRYKANRPSAADLADMRAYDPNGPFSFNNGMSETGAALGAAAMATPTQRRQPVPRKSSQLSPPTQSVSPQSNHNVSPVNDHNAPYARPPANGANELGDTRVLPAEMGGDDVVEMGDGRPRPPPPPPQHPGRQNVGFQSGPVSDVYEMPTERYR